MAVVKPAERTFASGVTNVTRNVAWAVGPSFAGVVMQHVALAGPLVIGGALKIAYDLLLYRAFVTCGRQRRSLQLLHGQASRPACSEGRPVCGL
jgi:predicted MFS family arabinose efflux permease